MSVNIQNLYTLPDQFLCDAMARYVMGWKPSRAAMDNGLYVDVWKKDHGGLISSVYRDLYKPLTEAHWAMPILTKLLEKVHDVRFTIDPEPDCVVTVRPDVPREILNYHGRGENNKDIWVHIFCCGQGFGGLMYRTICYAALYGYLSHDQKTLEDLLRESQNPEFSDFASTNAKSKLHRPD
jgi:hypothetical protein